LFLSACFLEFMADSQTLFTVALILQLLFALNFFAEGVHKMMEKEPAISSFAIGFIMILVIITVYIVMFAK